MSPAIKCLILLAVVALFFVTELIPLAVTAIGASVACGLLGLIPAKQVFSTFCRYVRCRRFHVLHRPGSRNW